jgi:hypothetical protein
MNNGLQRDLLPSTLLWSADEILSMNQKEIGRRVRLFIAWIILTLGPD